MYFATPLRITQRNVRVGRCTYQHRGGGGGKRGGGTVGYGIRTIWFNSFVHKHHFLNYMEGTVGYISGVDAELGWMWLLLNN